MPFLNANDNTLPFLMRTALDEVEAMAQSKGALDEDFIEATSAMLHERWLEEKGPKPFSPENHPYSELSPAEQEQYRIIVRQAIEVHANSTE